jgi:glucosamine-6-phosphate deaminase
MIQAFTVEKLQVKIFSNRREMGQAAGQSVAERMKEILRARKTLSIVFGSAPSQNEFLEELSQNVGSGMSNFLFFVSDPA